MSRTLEEQVFARRTPPCSLVGRTAGELRHIGYEIPAAIDGAAVLDRRLDAEPVRLVGLTMYSLSYVFRGARGWRMAS